MRRFFLKYQSLSGAGFGPAMVIASCGWVGVMVNDYGSRCYQEVIK